MELHDADPSLCEQDRMDFVPASSCCFGVWSSWPLPTQAAQVCSAGLPLLILPWQPMTDCIDCIIPRLTDTHTLADTHTHTPCVRMTLWHSLITNDLIHVPAHIMLMRGMQAAHRQGLLRRLHSSNSYQFTIMLLGISPLDNGRCRQCGEPSMTWISGPCAPSLSSLIEAFLLSPIIIAGWCDMAARLTWPYTLPTVRSEGKLGQVVPVNPAPGSDPHVWQFSVPGWSMDISIHSTS